MNSDSGLGIVLLCKLLLKHFKIFKIIKITKTCSQSETIPSPESLLIEVTILIKFKKTS